MQATDNVTIYVGTEPDPNDRVKLVLSRSEAAKIPPRVSRKVVEITDTTGRTYRIRTAACSIPGCRCALAFVEGGGGGAGRA